MLEPTNIFPNYSEDMIGLIVLRNDDKNPNGTVDNLVLECKNELLKFASEDILILSQISVIDDEERRFIKE